MHKKALYFSLLASAGIAGVALAAQIELDRDLMQNIEDSAKSLTSNIALQDTKAGEVDARELADMFAMVEAFYQQKGDAEEAVTLSRKSRDLSLQVGKDIAGHNFDHANELATTLTKTCKSCHTVYKKDT